MEYYPHFRSLHGAANDAERFCKWLCEEDGGGLDKLNVKRILSDLATRRPMQDEIDDKLLLVPCPIQSEERGASPSVSSIVADLM